MTNWSSFQKRKNKFNIYIISINTIRKTKLLKRFFILKTPLRLIRNIQKHIKQPSIKKKGSQQEYRAKLTSKQKGQR